MVARRKPEDSPKTRRPPATTPEARENQLIAMAFDAAEEQIKSGKATSQLLTHFLKLGTAKELLEREKLKNENALLEARAAQIAQGERMEDLLTRAIEAMAVYTGEGPEDAYED